MFLLISVDIDSSDSKRTIYWTRCVCVSVMTWWGPYIQHWLYLYGSAAGCRSIQKTCFLKAWIDFQNIQSHLTYFCKSNINQIFTNGGGTCMIWGVRIAIFTEIRHLVEELITFLSIFGPQKLGILTARLNKSLSISTSIQWEGISALKHAQSLHSYCENKSFWKNLWWDMWAMMHASKVSWIGITVCGRACGEWCKATWIGIIVFCNRMEDMPLYHIFKLIILLFGFIVVFDTSMFLLSFDTDWAQTTLVENTVLNAV